MKHGLGVLALTVTLALTAAAAQAALLDRDLDGNGEEVHDSVKRMAAGNLAVTRCFTGELGLALPVLQRDLDHYLAAPESARNLTTEANRPRRRRVVGFPQKSDTRKRMLQG